MEQIKKISYRRYRRKKEILMEKKQKDDKINIIIEAFNYSIKIKIIMKKKDMILVFTKK